MPGGRTGETIMQTRLHIVALITLALIGCAAPTTTLPAPSLAVATNPPSFTAAPMDTASAPSPESATGEAPPGAADAATPQPVGQMVEFDAPRGSHPHDVAPAPDGTVWFTAQRSGAMGRLDPATGAVRLIPLPAPSSPHGVVVGPDGAAWITDGGANAIVRVDGVSEEVQVFPLPQNRRYANLNTCAFDGNGVVWFTGQAGIYGRLDPATGVVEVFDAPGGRGPYGITATPQCEIYFASLAGSYIARVDLVTGAATVIEPPTPRQGARRVWSDSQGRIWVAEWNAGQLGLYDPATGAWREWRLPGSNPQAYAVFVDDQDVVWITDFGANALVRFDPSSEKIGRSTRLNSSH